MKRTYDFATIGFRPYAETEEFVTIGVVALDVAARHFDFILQKAQKTGRVLGMFPAIEKTLYREARNKLEAEFDGIRQAVNGLGVEVPLFPPFREKENGLFAAITSPREGVFCFPVKGRRMAEDMKTVLEKLKARFIDQDGFTIHQAAEQQMAKALRRVLEDAKILPAYAKDVKIGPEEYHVIFTLAHLTGDRRADRALRPLNFDLPTSTDIFNHGDEWTQKIKRLRQLGFRPDRCLVTAREPNEEAGLRRNAFLQIQKELLNDDFVFVGEFETDKVVDFARLPEAPDLKLA